MRPDTNYIPILARGTSLASNTGLKYVLTENIDCSLMLYMGITELMNEDVYYKSVESTSLSIGYTF